MSVTYLLAVSEPQARTFLEQGYDLVAGFAVDAAQAADITEVADFIKLLNLDFPGSPFAADKPIDIVHLPSDPFVQARAAVGPLDARAFRGGVIELGSYDGSGVARVGDFATDLVLLDPTRLTVGSRLWRFTPGSSEPELRGVYHGIAFGWENMATGTFKAGVPTPFVGPVVERPWGTVPVDVEVEGDKATAITLVAPAKPPMEDGFEELESGMWAKRVEVNDSTRIFTQILVGDLSGIPVRVVRTVATPDKQLMFQIVSLIPDAPYNTRARMQRWSTGTFTSIAKPESLTKQRKQEAVPLSWSQDKRELVTAKTNEPIDIDNEEALVQMALGLLGQTAPENWQNLMVRMQFVGTSTIYEAHALLPENKLARLRVIPSAVIHYMRRIKQIPSERNKVPFLTAILRMEKTGKGNIQVNADTQPQWHDLVQPNDWKTELELYPRAADDVPDWMLEKLQAADSSVCAPASEFADVTANAAPAPEPEQKAE